MKLVHFAIYYREILHFEIYNPRGLSHLNDLGVKSYILKLFNPNLKPLILASSYTLGKELLHPRDFQRFIHNAELIGPMGYYRTLCALFSVLWLTAPYLEQITELLAQWWAFRPRICKISARYQVFYRDLGPLIQHRRFYAGSHTILWDCPNLSQSNSMWLQFGSFAGCLMLVMPSCSGKVMNFLA